jgi:hypothetical protein
MYDLEGNHPRTSSRLIDDRVHATGVAADGSGAYVVAQAEHRDPTAGLVPFGSFLLKFDSTDSYEWQRRVTARSSTQAYGVTLANSGVWITGRAFDRLTNRAGTSRDEWGDAFLVRFSRQGQPRLTYQYSQPGVQVAWSVAADYAGIYIVGLAERFRGTFSKGQFDGLLLSAELP